MKKRFTAMLASLLLVALLIPGAAFATSGHILASLDLTTGNHTGKTLASDGYTWDESTHTLTMQDLNVTGDIHLPNTDCNINIKGTCAAGKITYNNSGITPALLVNGVNNASFQGTFETSGDLTLQNLTMTNGGIYNGFVGGTTVLRLVNSNVTLYTMSWQTDGGINLVNSQLTVTALTDNGQFVTEMIAMDRNSVIESYHRMYNYGKFTPDTLGEVSNYVAVPEGGSFANTPPFKDSTDNPLTVVDENGQTASHFILRAPKEQCKIDLKAAPAEGGTVTGAGTYDYQGSATVKAEANKGYHFVQWEDEQGAVLSKDAAYTFTVNGSATLTAVFEKGSAVTPSQSGGSDQNNSGSPKTSDPTHMELWIALLAISMMGIAGTVIARKINS